jgi:xylitol oxidase
MPVLALIEEQLAPYDVRPHWGKLFCLGADRLSELYPRYHDFARLMRDYDRAGTFQNALLRSWFPSVT